MYRGEPPTGRLMPIRNPYIDQHTEDVRASYCFDQISLIEGPMFSLRLHEFVWKVLSPTSSSTKPKLVKKFLKFMGKIDAHKISDMSICRIKNSKETDTFHRLHPPYIPVRSDSKLENCFIDLLKIFVPTKDCVKCHIKRYESV